MAFRRSPLPGTRCAWHRQGWHCKGLPRASSRAFAWPRISIEASGRQKRHTALKPPMSSHVLKQTQQDATAAARSAYFATAFQTDEEQVTAPCCVVLFLSYAQRLLCGIPPILFTALAVCVLPLAYVQRLLCGMTPILLTALALWLGTSVVVWHCPYPVCKRLLRGLTSSNVQRLLCGFASNLWAAVAVWHCPRPVYVACCVVLLLSYELWLLCRIAPIPFTHRLLCGVCLLLTYVQPYLCSIAPILFTALAVRNCFYLMYSGCCVALLLSCLQRLLCGIASILCTAAAVWHCPYPVYSACCVVLCLSYLQRLLCGLAPVETLTYNFLFP